MLGSDLPSHVLVQSKQLQHDYNHKQIMIQNTVYFNFQTKNDAITMTLFSS
jgi:hypothetical protein